MNEIMIHWTDRAALYDNDKYDTYTLFTSNHNIPTTKGLLLDSIESPWIVVCICHQWKCDSTVIYIHGKFTYCSVYMIMILIEQVIFSCICQ